MDNLDQSILNDLCTPMGRSQQKKFLEMYHKSKNEPFVKMLMSIFKDMLVYKELTNSMVIEMKMKMKLFERRLKLLEDNQDFEI